MRTLLVGFVCVVWAVAAEAPVRELVTQALPFAKSQIPWFRHGYVVTFPPGGVAGTQASSVLYGFTAYGPDGTFAYEKDVDLPGANHVVRDVDFDAEGNAVAASTGRGGANGFLSGMLLLDRAGRQTGFVDTGRYVPAHVALAPDGSIWTLGWQMDADRPPYADKQDYLVVRHFSKDGAQLGAYLPRSSFPAGLEPGVGGAGPEIRVSRDRVGLFAFSGKTSAETEWLELDMNGNVLSRARVDNAVPRVYAVAFTADDHVYLGCNKGEVYTLDAASHAWTQIENHGGMLMGADGTALVYRKPVAGPVQLQWFSEPQ